MSRRLVVSCLIVFCLVVTLLSSLLHHLFFSPAMSILNDDEGLNLEDIQEDAHYGSLPPVPLSLTSHHPSPSLMSSPSGLAVDTIAWLTHDELCLNPEFMKYVRMVDALQELPGLWEKMSKCKFFFAFIVMANCLFLIFF